MLRNNMDLMRENAVYLTTGAVVIGVSILLYKKLRKRARICGVDYPKDKVMLHVFPPNKRIPNMGHFVMKLETYLRIHKIPYQLDLNYNGGPKAKTPWIEYNGITMGDSQLIIQYLNKKFNVNMNQHLTNEEKAIAWAIQKWLEEYTYWLNVHTRWNIFFDDMLNNYLGIPKLTIALLGIYIKRKMASTLYAIGIGRHSNEEVHDMMINDLRQFSEILGNKKFVMGDKITETDCTAFGVLSQVRWCTPVKCPGHQLLHGGELQNVLDYLDRVKDAYWRDWDDIIAAVGK